MKKWRNGTSESPGPRVQAAHTLGTASVPAMWRLTSGSWTTQARVLIPDEMQEIKRLGSTTTTHIPSAPALAALSIFALGL